MTSNLPMTVRISTLDRQITALSEVLAPRADDDITARCFKSLLASGIVFPASIDPAIAPEVYGFALAGLPAAALRRVTEMLIRGETCRDDPGFLPKPPELAILVREQARRLQDDLRRLKETRSTLAETERERNREPHTDAMKARVRSLVAAVTRSLTGEHKGEKP